MIKNHIPAPTPIAMMAAKRSQRYSGLFHFYQFENETKCLEVNRYRRGLETCPQAKTSKSGHGIFFSFFRRVRATSMTQHQVENTRVHFWTFSPVSVKINDLELKLNDSSESDSFFFFFLLFLIHQNLFWFLLLSLIFGLRCDSCQ